MKDDAAAQEQQEDQLLADVEKQMPKEEEPEPQAEEPQNEAREGSPDLETRIAEVLGPEHAEKAQAEPVKKLQLPVKSASPGPRQYSGRGEQNLNRF